MTRSSKRQQRRAETAEAKRRAWLGQELEDGATAGLVLDYVQLHHDLADQIRLAREAFCMPTRRLDPNKVTEEYEPDRTVAGRVIPADWSDEELHPTSDLPDLNREAVSREKIRTAERLRLGRLEGDYRTLLHGELDGVPGWPLHPSLHTFIAQQIQDDATTALLWPCLQTHRLLASVAKGGQESLVKRRKAMEARWRYLIEAFERDLGRRPPSKGPTRTLSGKPQILVADYLKERSGERSRTRGRDDR